MPEKLSSELCTKARRETGIKDTYQMFFVDKLVSSYKTRRGAARQAGLDAAIQVLPERVTSSVWRIRGLNPHSDTPVEILHVVLLGFVKYLWRDVVKNQLKDKPDKKAILSACLSSVWMEGLGLDSLLAGNTLINYCGSLTGGDFRKLAQVALFVLHGLVASECYATWLSLSKLIPLIWQPEIRDLDSHIATLKGEIQNFLVLSAKWSIRWFNKPKFHILVHLPEHIRRFGPAALFATETFESFNAVIREKSVHSNRHAPSHDLAVAFAAGNRTRHFSSGGKFLQVGELTEMWTEDEKKAEMDFEDASLPQAQRVTRVQRYFRKFTADERHWRSVGPGPRHLLNLSKDTIGHYLGLTISKQEKSKVQALMCTLDNSAAPIAFSSTKTGQRFPDSELFPPEAQQSSAKRFRVAKEVFLANGDRCSVSAEPVLRRDKQKFSSASPFVIVRRRALAQTDSPLNSGDGTQSAVTLHVARATEILQHLGDASTIALAKYANSILVQLYSTSREPSVSGMPRLTAQDIYIALRPTDVLCTVNVQHDCIRNKCEVKEIHFRRQEHHVTTIRKGAVEHVGDLQDILLNTAQMRDAIHVQRFRIAPKLLNVTQTLMESAKREVDSQDRTKQTQHGSVNIRPSSSMELRSPGRSSPGPQPQPNEGLSLHTSRNPYAHALQHSDQHRPPALSPRNHQSSNTEHLPPPSDQPIHPAFSPPRANEESLDMRRVLPQLNVMSQTAYLNESIYWSPAAGRSVSDTPYFTPGHQTGTSSLRELSAMNEHPASRYAGSTFSVESHNHNQSQNAPHASASQQNRTLHQSVHSSSPQQLNFGHRPHAAFSSQPVLQFSAGHPSSSQQPYIPAEDIPSSYQYAHTPVQNIPPARSGGRYQPHQSSSLRHESTARDFGHVPDQSSGGWQS